MDVKSLGQVFTPEHIVNDILDLSNYKENILRKNIIDNSCGNGAFLQEIIKRYVEEYMKENGNTEGVENELEQYIHGIEIDKEIYNECIENLEELRKKLDLKKIKWDILNKNTLLVKKFNGEMDYVVGNPPYVRIHNLDEQLKETKKQDFCDKGMVDLYLAFFEIGFEMLKDDGVLCYITPNSFYNSIAGGKLREYIKETKTLETIMDLGHYQPFAVNAYTAISKFTNGVQHEQCGYYKYNSNTGKPEYVCNIDYTQLFINDNIILNEDNNRYRNILKYSTDNPTVKVKNAFATLSDKIFISNQFDFNNNIIDIIKASTGEWKKCIYPYDENGKIIPFEDLGEEEQEYLLQNETSLKKRSLEKRAKWYGFGRSQAINDVQRKKICINTTIKDIDSIKISVVEGGQGVYSGLYMLTEIPVENIREAIISNDFIEYIKVINKCKSGGYYTFSTNDLYKYINYKMEEIYG